MDSERERAIRLGAIIRQRRREQGLTLVQVAERVGVTHGFLSQLERGRSNASLRTLYLIAQTLGTTQQYLLAAGSPGVGNEPLRRDENSGFDGTRVLLGWRDSLSVTEFTKRQGPPGEYFEHPEPEFLFVLSGRLNVESLVAPGESALTELGEGDSFLIPGHRPHRHFSAAGTSRYLLLTLPL